ncbi:MAG: hypothetical protein QOI73_2071 [Solirubrobacteraceae bacterium]|jgi:hypothetical protein|nr:hypothetical protein [Solirubrobacteraceae bacterium]
MAGLTVQCRDEMGDGEWLMELKLPVASESPTVRELITTRVQTETTQHNAELDRGRQFRGLVTAPPAVTSELNGWAGRKREGKAVEPDKMLKIALDAYEQGDLELLVDDQPAGDIDSEVTLADGSVVLFRKKAVLVVPQENPGRKRSKHEKMPRRR